MRSPRYAAALATLLLAGCPPPRSAVQCGENSHCDLDPGGVCTSVDTGNRWCAYPDTDCPSGYRYSDFDVGDGVSGICVPEAARRTLTVQLGGKGAGSITTEPAGLTCSADTCTGEFLVGATVKLSAAATTGSFLGWIDGCRGTDACEVAMDSDRAVGALFGERGEALWVKQLGNTASDNGSGVAIDSHGDLIAVGRFAQTITPAPGVVLTSAGDQDIYVIKLSGATGNVIWAKRFGGARSDGATSVAVDASDEIYIAGTFFGTVDLGSGPKQVADLNAGAFVLKLRSNGDYGWDRTFEANVFYTTTLAVHGDSLVLAGAVGRSMTVDGVPYTNPGSVNAFAIRMSPAVGAVSWMRVFGAAADAVVRADGVAIDSEGNVVMVGDFTGVVNFGSGNLSGGDREDVFLLKLASDGAHLFSKRFGSTGFDRGSAIAVDSTSGILITGLFEHTVSFGCPGSLTTSNPIDGNPDLFVAKYTQAGACVWVKGFGIPSTGEHIYGASVSSMGEITLTGTFSSSISFGGATLTSGGRLDAFAVRLEPDGSHLSSVRAGGSSDDRSHDIAEAVDGRFYVTGGFQTFAEFGGETRTALGFDDSFVAAFAPL